MSLHLNLFPTNGLDRSLHLPIFVGLLLVTLFTETFGWTYAGLVVPGYLAATFMATPFTGLLIVVEACLSYLLTYFIGLWVPKTGAWSTTFGRERFFLFIVSAMLVRLGVEGYVVPAVLAHYSLAHSRELYGIGLVLVPLTSNVFWNAGFKSSAPRLAITTLLTYAILEYGFARHTNFTLAHFLVANESGEFDFIRSSKAQLILLIGAMLGARGNVLYGWDYNGILVPSLLGVAWYEPRKLASTFIEAIVVFFVVKWLMSKRPFSRMLIVGSRRMLLTFTVGFVLKFALSFVALRFWPRLTVTDLFGFGYLLPSLLAVKMWNKGQMGVVLMPAIQVSLTAFLAGNAVGYGLSLASPVFREAPLSILVEESSDPLYLPLLKGDLAPPVTDRNLGEVARLASAAALRAIAGPEPAAKELAVEAPLRHLRILRSKDGRFSAVAPRPDEPGTLAYAPRLVVRNAPRAPRGLFFVVRAPPAASPLLEATGVLSEHFNASGWMIVSRYDAFAPLDNAFASRVEAALGVEQRLEVEESEETSELRVCGGVPRALDLAELRVAVGLPGLSVRWVACEGTKVTLALTSKDARAMVERLHDEPPFEIWEGPLARALYTRAEGLTLARDATPPRLEDRRLFGALFRNFEGFDSTSKRALARSLGYRFARVVTEGKEEALVAFEPTTAERRGAPTLVFRPRASHDLAVEVPAPRWEAGTLSAATTLLAALDARHLLIAGHLPRGEGARDARSDVTTYYQRAHEVWLEHGGKALSVQGIAPDRAVDAPIIFSFGREIPVPQLEPTWGGEVRGLLGAYGFPIGAFDGSANHVAFGGSGDPAMVYAEHFARDSFAVLWLTQEARAPFAELDARSAFGETGPSQATLAPLSDAVLAAKSCGGSATCRSCDLERAEEAWWEVARTRNPLGLRAFLRDSCLPKFARGPIHGDVWVVFGASKGVRAIPTALRRRFPTARVDSLESFSTKVNLGIVPIAIEVP